ncbi:GAF domain-containing protein [Frondihabitans sp. VKM Ac-2883]|uniref:GAF domain-containing protein n=1 Tax=Frondihabitans sp. VKM Ac-2883 TaxID=2783823 RepID=UPI00188A38AD|nr:GAF domain-containing protein [Frondihabitans sp. VKM Ac-2883]MBF4577549.1 GAF domain-containing protein [Frondihabitans sp. VKM Ac-2883]
MYELLRPVMKAWYAREIAAGRSSPKPLDSPTVVAKQPDADKVLLIGNGPLHGWGVLTHQLSITGHLAYGTQAETGRPCTVHYIGDEAMTIASTRAWIGDHDLTQYDAVVTVLGMNDAVRLTPLKKWDEHYRALLEFLTEQTTPGTPMVVVGLQPVRSVIPFNKPLGNVAAFHGGRMNKILEDIAADFSALTYFRLPEPVMDPRMPLGSSSMYRSWAADIAAYLLPALDMARSLHSVPREPLAREQHAWSGTETLIHQAEDGGSAELQRLAALAMNTFSVDLAGVSLIDGDRVWFAVNTAVLPKSAPAELVYCNTVVQQQAPLLVEDAQRDPRFRGNAFIDITGMDFYAGHPLTSTEGETIGTFCLFNSSPKAAETISMDALKMLAVQAETELRRYENPPPTPAPTPTNRPAQH